MREESGIGTLLPLNWPVLYHIAYVVGEPRVVHGIPDLQPPRSPAPEIHRITAQNGKPIPAGEYTLQLEDNRTRFRISNGLAGWIFHGQAS